MIIQTSLISLTPLFSIMLGVLSSAFLLIGHVWFGKLDFHRMTPIAHGLRGIIFALLLAFAFLQLDSAIKYLFFQPLSMGNLSYQIASVILSLIWGITVIFVVVLNAPTLKTLISFVLCIISFVYIAWVQTAIDSEVDMITLPLIYFIVIAMGIEILFLLLNGLLKKPLFKMKNMWDLTEKTQRVLNTKFGMVMSWLFGIELILNFEGLSLLYWL